MGKSQLLVAACAIWVVTLPCTGWAQIAESGMAAALDTDTEAVAVKPVRLPGALAGSLERPIIWAGVNDSRFAAVQQPAPRKRSWIGRHPVLVGALVGFGAGYLIGYSAGDDGVFYDFTAGFNGGVLGGAGALAGAVVGAVAAH